MGVVRPDRQRRREIYGDNRSRVLLRTKRIVPPMLDLCLKCREHARFIHRPSIYAPCPRSCYDAGYQRYRSARLFPDPPRPLDFCSPKYMTAEYRRLKRNEIIIPVQLATQKYVKLFVNVFFF